MSELATNPRRADRGYNCGSCDFWHSLGKVPVTVVRRRPQSGAPPERVTVTTYPGHCHRRAPTSDTHGVAVYPQTTNKHWCGEYEAAPGVTSGEDGAP